MLRLLTVVLALSASTLATPFITEPVGATTWNAAQTQTVKWEEDKGATAPTLAQFGPSNIFLAVGNAQQQTKLQTVASNVDLSKVNQVNFKIQPDIGPDANVYFIRIESIAAKDPATPIIPALAFSAKFTLTGMTGTFKDDVKAQINGLSTAPLGSTIVPSFASTTSTPATTSKPLLGATTTGTSKTTSTAKTSPTPTNAAGSASDRMSGFMMAAGAAAIGAALL